ncbi:exonuclease SbcCD subunit D [Microbacterium esteraromaticum]|uniref:Nuclease SbcCD subunit D n=1 Tax=Microbacterium esteraromaticum TaxID=57043 RepID=A0A939DVW1_9MICO|nr:exonuclease SbcCD subunit D [Microbacterium esteraromaticum]MBN8205232.1 exonuclease SbcCD subunit D [Microbacterium esteraromaticum]MBN8415386.1 exonuclease SbcCD subunit D [Microbacterium esteraromaticum]MBY6060179.1 exonuclease SbcCD subunit D [Microbacterium esteraromaticum]
MRILHTSDWHIGRTFHGHSTLAALAEVLDALVAQVRSHDVDVVIVAGDVFDSATPAAAAYTLLDEALLALHETGATVIMTSGNHDSIARLGFHSRLLREGIHVLTDPAGIATPVTVRDAHGPVHFFGIPYLEPAIVRQHWSDGADAGDQPPVLRTQAQVMHHAMSLVRDGMTAHEGRSVAIAHCFAAGVEVTDGLEREVRQGGLDVVPLSSFDGPDYVALGHIHGRQQLSDRVRYSGAPLHYSFGEQHKERGSWLVDLDAEGLAAVEWLALPVPRALVTLTGTLDEILSEANAARHADQWVCAVYTDAVPQHEPMRRLRERFPFCALVQHQPDGADAGDERSYSERLRSAITDVERIEAFLMHVRAGQGATPHEAELIRDVLDDRVRAEALV